MTKVAAVAEPNSVCPKQHQTALEAVAAAMPNSYWLFVECGNWGPSHPQAGSPARAVLHTLLYTQGLSADPQLCTQLDSLHGCFYTWNAYMLDSTGWPNSECHEHNDSRSCCSVRGLDQAQANNRKQLACVEACIKLCIKALISSAKPIGIIGYDSM